MLFVASCVLMDVRCLSFSHKRFVRHCFEYHCFEYHCFEYQCFLLRQRLALKLFALFEYTTTK